MLQILAYILSKYNESDDNFQGRLILDSPSIVFIYEVFNVFLPYHSTQLKNDLHSEQYWNTMIPEIFAGKSDEVIGSFLPEKFMKIKVPYFNIIFDF